jgi:cytidylate kinase
MIIAIDGPAASGKSTVARALADELDLTFLDTGAMYRAVTLEVQRQDADPCDAEACSAIAAGIELGFDANGRVLISGEAGEPAIRSATVTGMVSFVAAHPGVRRAIVPKQREIAARSGVVAEGRDTTTVVFPNADHKFFLLASAAERARRRAQEEGHPERAALIEIDIERRDRLDSEREDSPLMQAQDAVVVSTDGITPEEVLAQLLKTVRAGQAS